MPDRAGVAGITPIGTGGIKMDNRTSYSRGTAVRRRTVKRKSGSDNKITALFDLLRPSKNPPDYIFLAVVLILLAYGIMMLFSASNARALANYGDSFHFIKRQLFWAIIGGVAMFACSKLDYHILGGKVAGIIYLVCLGLLILVISGLGTTVNGSTRWLFRFQPSEAAKFAIILIFAYNLSQPNGQRDLKCCEKGIGKKYIKSFCTSLLPYIIMLVIYFLFIALQPHFSCIVLIGLTAVLMLFVAGTPLKHFFVIGGPAIAAALIYALSADYRVARLTSFLDPFADARGDGWQIVQSLYAIGSGGIFGVGLGESRQKFMSLPEPHNDFIFSVLSEELGLVGAVVLIVLFIILVVRGIRIAAKAPDLFGTLLVIGIVGIVALQALINIAVVTSTIPVTGMPLPFFSYGGTALCITLAEMGIVLNVSRQSQVS